MKKKMNKKGFTLVELLAVVVVLAIVAAIAMRSITGIIKNNRIDSYIASVNSAIEGAQLSCVQDGNVKNIAQTVEGTGVTVAPTSDNDDVNEFTVTATATGEFKSLKAEEVKARAFKSDGITPNRIKGLKNVGEANGDSVSCADVAGHVQCTITYNTCTSSY